MVEKWREMKLASWAAGGEGRAAGGLQARLPPVLAQCKYQLRLKGFMRPRR